MFITQMVFMYIFQVWHLFLYEYNIHVQSCYQYEST